MGRLPLELLPEFIARGFSPASIEAWLEMRAQCAALLRARNPHLALASCTAFLPSSRFQPTPHAVGYAELMERFVAELDRRRGELLELVPEANLLQQLHHLDAADIRSIAAKLAKELDLPVQHPDVLDEG